MASEYPQARVLGERSLAVWTRAGNPEGAYHLYTCKPGEAQFTVERLERSGNLSHAARRAGHGRDLPPDTPSTYVIVERVQVADPAAVLQQMRADADRRFTVKSWL